MSTSINNPKFLSTNDSPEANAFTPTNQLVDDADFPHSGLFKVLNLAIAGNYATAGFNATAVTNTSITIAEGTVFRQGKLITVNSGSTQTIANVPATANTYHLLVNATGTTTLTLRSANTTNSIPNFTAGDVVIAVLKGGTTPMQIQYLTFNQESNTLSLGRSNSGAYVEGLEIVANGAVNGDYDINLKESNGDLAINTQAGTQALRIDGQYANVRIGEGGTSVGNELEIAGTASAVTNSPTLELENNNSTSTSSRLQFTRNSAGLTDGATIGDIVFIAKDSSSGSYEYTRIEAQIDDESAGTGDGRLIFFAQKAGSEVEFIRFDGNNGIIFNEGSAVINFRVESNGDTNMLFVDATNDRVGIGTGTPTEALDVEGTIAATGQGGAIKASTTIHSPRLEVVTSNNASLTLTAATHAGRYLMYSASNGTITLPATSTSGEHYTILNLTGGNITVAHGGNNINGAGANITVATYNGVTCISEASNNWVALGV